MARLEGDLHVTGNISAANYPPECCENYEWEISGENAGQRVYYIQHGFSAKFLRCNVYDVDEDCEVFPAIQYGGVGVVTVYFAEPPRIGKKFKIVITYHGESDQEE